MTSKIPPPNLLGRFENLLDISGKESIAMKAVTTSATCVRTMVFITPGIISFVVMLANQV